MNSKKLLSLARDLQLKSQQHIEQETRLSNPFILEYERSRCKEIIKKLRNDIEKIVDEINQEILNPSYSL